MPPRSPPTDHSLQVAFIQTAHMPCPDVHILASLLINKAQGWPRRPLCDDAVFIRVPHTSSHLELPALLHPPIRSDPCVRPGGTEKTNGEFLIFSLLISYAAVLEVASARDYGWMFVLRVAEAAWWRHRRQQFVDCRSFVECEDKA